MASGCPADTQLAGKADVCKGCPGQALCSSLGEVDPDQSHLDIRMKAIKHKIMVLSGKGGVGKSSVAAMLSIALGKLNKMTGLCDLDICGPSVSHLMGVKGQQILETPYGWQPLKSPHSNVKVMSVASLLQDNDSAVIWRGPRKTALIKRFLKDTFWGRLDFLIFDTPPGTSDEHLSVIRALKNVSIDGAILVTTPQDLALITIRKEINFCRKMGVNIIGVVSNMCFYVCPCCKVESNVFVDKGTEELCREYGIPFLGKLPLDQEFVKVCERGESIFDQPESGLAASIVRMAEDLIKL